MMESRKASPGLNAVDDETTLDFETLGSLSTFFFVSLVSNDANNNNVVKIYTFDPNDSMEHFLTKASIQLDMIPQATHAYSDNGILLTDCLMIDTGDTVCLSRGKLTVPAGGIIQKNDSEKTKHDRLSLGRDKLPNKIESYVVSTLMGIDTLGRQLCIGTGEISGAQVRRRMMPTTPTIFPLPQQFILSIIP